MDPPFDRALALAAQVRTMKDHFLEVRCDGCGDRRVIGLGQMAKDARVRTAVAHVALKVRCHGCHDGPTAMHLCATVNGLEPSTYGSGVVWSIPLVKRSAEVAFRRRRMRSRAAPLQVPAAQAGKPHGGCEQRP